MLVLCRCYHFTASDKLARRHGYLTPSCLMKGWGYSVDGRGGQAGRSEQKGEVLRCGRKTEFAWEAPGGHESFFVFQFLDLSVVYVSCSQYILSSHINN